jgi:uncharacterized membrane protein
LSLHQYKALILIVSSVFALFAASPVIQQFLVFSQPENLTEIALFGQYHNTTYPYNITRDQQYQLYLNITNHLGSAAYYNVEVKFRNQTQSAPNSFSHTASELPPLCKITALAANNQSIEIPIQIVLHYGWKKPAQIMLNSITLNGYNLDTNSAVLNWDFQRIGFFGNLFFELWIYNGTIGSFEYNQRYVSLWFNMTM